MEQNVNRPAHLMGAADAHALRVEASDTVSGSWVKMVILNVIGFVLPLLLPAAFGLLMGRMGLPMEGVNLLAVIGGALAGLAIQSYLLPGFSSGLIRVALGQRVPVSRMTEGMEKAGNMLCLMLLMIIALAVCALPGAAVLFFLGGKSGLVGLALKVCGGALLAAGVIFAFLRYGLALFCMTDAGDDCALAAMMHSAKLMKGNTLKALRAMIPPVLIALGLAVAVALLRWPLSVQRDFLTDGLMYAGTAAYAVYVVFVYLQIQAMMANIYVARKE